MISTRQVRRLLADHPGVKATSRHTRALTLFDGVSSLGSRGAYIGDVISGGGDHCHDPWELYPHVITNPNMMFMGDLGQGKTASLKIYLRRQWCLGRQIRIIDSHPLKHRPVGEYTPLVEDLGGVHVKLARGSGVRLNPLTNPEDRHRLLEGAARGALTRDLSDREPAILTAALDWVCTFREEPIIPEVVEALLNPSEWMAAELRAGEREVRNEARGVAMALRRLCRGEHAGMLDGPTSTGINFDAQVLSVDLSALHDSPTLGIVMSGAIASVQAHLDRQRDRQRTAGLPAGQLDIDHATAESDLKTVFVMDETYRIFGIAGLGEWLQDQFKVSRKIGQQNVLVVHAPSDFHAAGDDGSRKMKLITGLRKHCQTYVLFNPNDEDTLTETAEMLGLTKTAKYLLSTLVRGQALWIVGPHRFIVQTAPHGRDWDIINTDQGMSARASRPSASRHAQAA